MGEVDEKDLVRTSLLAADSETVQLRQANAPDEERLRQLTLLKIAQDCLAGGYLTFAFTAVSEPRAHLPDKPPGAPVEFVSTRTFDPPTAIVPEIKPGTLLTVKFFKAGDPAAGNSIYAELIVANLRQPLQH